MTRRVTILVCLLLLPLAGCRRSVDLPLFDPAPDASPDADGSGDAAFDAASDIRSDLGPQPYLFVWTAVPTGAVDGQAIATDPTSHALVAGSLRGTVTFGTLTLKPSPGQDLLRAFVARIAPDGTFLWAGQAEGTGTSAIRAVEMHGTDGIVAGESSGSVTLGGHDVSGGFVARIDAQGSVAWAATASATQGLQVRGVTVDAAGNSTITGSFAGTATFGTHALISAGSHDWFAARLDGQGSFAWATGGDSADPEHAVDIGSDGAGNCYVAMQHTGAGSEVTLHVIKLDPAGAQLWNAKAVASYGWAELNGIAVDDAGSSLIIGTSAVSINLGNATQIAIEQGKFNASLFVAGLDAQGSFQWGKALAGGPGPSGYVETQFHGAAIAVDGKLGGGYFTGSYSGDPMGATYARDVLIGRLLHDNDFYWVVTGGSAGNDTGRDIAFDAAGYVWVVGSLAGTALLAGQTLSGGGTFITRLLSY